MTKEHKIILRGVATSMSLIEQEIERLQNAVINLKGQIDYLESELPVDEEEEF